jgi:hypothetical protein
MPLITQTVMMEAATVSEALDCSSILVTVTDHEDFSAFSHRETLKFI